MMLMAIPVLRFRHQPGTMFVSGLTAWGLLTLTYIAMELRYSLLESRMGALQVFMMGAVSCGFVAVFQWVMATCCAELRQRPRHIAQSACNPLLSAPPRQLPADPHAFLRKAARHASTRTHTKER